MRNNNTPSQAWWNGMNQLFAKKLSGKVILELNAHPDLVFKLGDKYHSFIIWAGWQRLDYEENLIEEVEDYLSGKFKKRERLHYINAAEWRGIRKQVFKRDNYTCVYCKASGENIVLECDHVIPFSKGGSDELENLVTACFSCNRSKRDKSLEEFLKKFNS